MAICPSQCLTAENSFVLFSVKIGSPPLTYLTASLCVSDNCSKDLGPLQLRHLWSDNLNSGPRPNLTLSER